ncbi:MAG: DUF4116 domain-containing protein [Candidatus Margulisbacteria bacterium]|jgi:hypothetical protein|nr:DUF4116 domain-containing protein [Candidatus Margulisiibacteriota bacterium]
MQTKLIADTISRLEKGFIRYSEVKPALWKNKEFVLAVAKRDNLAFVYANVRLTKNKEFMLDAAQENWPAFAYADVSLKKDRKFMSDAAKQYWRALEFADDSLKKMENLCWTPLNDIGARWSSPMTV